MSPQARRVGVMGGTFDPIHHGHLVAASEVQAWFELDEVVFVPTGEPWQKSDRQVTAGRAPLPDDGDRHRVQPAVLGLARRHRPRRPDVHHRHAARPARASGPTPTSTSSPARTRWPTSSPGATPTSSSSWRSSSAVPGPASRWTPTRSPRSRPTGSRWSRCRRWRSARPTAGDVRCEGEPVWYLVPDGVVQYIAKHHLYPPPDRHPTRESRHDRHRPRRRASSTSPRARPPTSWPSTSWPSTSATSSRSPTRSCSPRRATTAR